MGFRVYFIAIVALLAPVGGKAGEPCSTRLSTVVSLLSGPARSGWGTPRSGVEFEFAHPPTLSRASIAEIIVTTLQERGGHYQNVTVEPNGNAFRVNFERAGESLSERWEVKLDGTIIPGNGNLGTEVTTPPMRTAFDRETAWIVLERLRDRGARPNRSTGLHVHVEGNGLGPEGVAAAYLLFAEVEEQLAAIFRVVESRRENAATPIAYSARLLASRMESGSISEIGEIIAMSGDRQRALNLRSMGTLGTLEFRIFNGSTERVYAQAAAQFCIEFVRAVRARDPRLVAYLRRLEGRVPQLLELAQVIGAPLPAQHPHFLQAVTEGLRSPRETFSDVPTALLGVALLGSLGIDLGAEDMEEGR